MSTRDTLQDSLGQAQRFLDDVWNTETNTVSPVDSQYLDQSVRMARQMVISARRLIADMAETPKRLTLSFEKAHQVSGNSGGQLEIPERFTVRQISGSIAWMPGQTLDKSQVALLLEDASWVVTIQ